MLARMRSVAFVVALVGVVHADPPKAELNMAIQLDKPALGATPVLEPGGATSYVTLGTKVVPTSIEVVSLENENARFQLHLRMPAQVPKGRWPVIGTGGTWWRAESHGGDDKMGDASFTLDRATAETFAKAYGVAMKERTPLGDKLVYTWTIAKTATTKKGDRIAVKLRVANKGKTPIGFLVGGNFTERGDENFVPEIESGGKPVPLVQTYGGNGGMTYQRIAPGKSIEVTTDLRGYPEGAFGTAGTYTVALRYEGTLAAPDDKSKVWSVAPATTAKIVVK